MIKLILFTAIQLLSIIISTMKYVLTGSSKPWVATLINAISVCVGNLVTILLVQQNATFALIITFVDTVIGVPVARWLIDKFSKDRLFIYTATIECSTSRIADIRKKLKSECDIHSNFQSIVDNELYSLTIYSKSKKDSKIITDYLKQLNAKYHVIEAR